jgi:Fibronectin type III domain
MGPLSVIKRTETEITLSWSKLKGSVTGNSKILSYNLYWDNASGLPQIKLVSTLKNEFTVTGTVGGLTYIFIIRAQNVYGEGPSSE